MSISGLLQTAIGLFGIFVVTSQVLLAASPVDATAQSAVVMQAQRDSPLVPNEAENCRYKPLPGSHIRVHVCTTKDGIEYRMERKARTIAAVIPNSGNGTVIAAPLPQVQ